MTKIQSVDGESACFETRNHFFAIKIPYSDSLNLSLPSHIAYNVIRLDLIIFVFSTSLHTNKCLRTVAYITVGFSQRKSLTMPGTVLAQSAIFATRTPK